MIAAMLAAAALGNSITAPKGFYARAWWTGSDHSTVQALLENQTGRSREAVTLRCKLYEGADPVVKGATMGYPGKMDPHEAQQVWTPNGGLQPGVHPTRFACTVTEGFGQ